MNLKRSFNSEFKAHKIQQPLGNVQENKRKTRKQISMKEDLKIIFLNCIE